MVQNCITNTLSAHKVPYLCTPQIAMAGKTPLQFDLTVLRGRVIFGDFFGGEGGEIWYVFYHTHMKHSNHVYTFI